MHIARADPEPVRHPEGEVLQHHVGPCEQPIDHLPRGGGFEVEQYRALACIDPSVAHDCGVGGVVDLDHVGAVLGQHATSGRSSKHLGEVDDANAIERQVIAVRAGPGWGGIGHSVRPTKRGWGGRIRARSRSQRCSGQDDGLTDLTSGSQTRVDDLDDRLALECVIVVQPFFGCLAQRGWGSALIIYGGFPLRCGSLADELGEACGKFGVQLGLGQEPLTVGETVCEPARGKRLDEPPEMMPGEQAEVDPLAVGALVVPEPCRNRALEPRCCDVVTHLELGPEDVKGHVVQRHVDDRTLPCSPAGDECRDCGVGSDEGGVGGQQRRRSEDGNVVYRRSTGGDAHRAVDRCRRRNHTFPARHRRSLVMPCETRDPGIHNARIQRPSRLGPQAETFHHPRAEVLDEYIGGGDHVQSAMDVVLVLQVESDTLLTPLQDGLCIGVP